MIRHPGRSEEISLVSSVDKDLRLDRLPCVHRRGDNPRAFALDRSQTAPQTDFYSCFFQHFEIERLGSRWRKVANAPDPVIEPSCQAADGFVFTDIGGCQPAGGESADMVVKTKKKDLLAHASSLNGCGHTSRRATVDEDIARDDFWFPRLYLLIIMRIASERCHSEACKYYYSES